MSSREERIYEECKLDILANWLLFIIREGNVENNSFSILPEIYDLKVKVSKMEDNLIIKYKQELENAGYGSLIKYMEVNDFNKLIVPIYIKKYIRNVFLLEMDDVNYSPSEGKNTLIHKFIGELRRMNFSINMNNSEFAEILIEKYLSSLNISNSSSKTSEEYVLETLFLLKEIVSLSTEEEKSFPEELLIYDINKLIDSYASNLEMEDSKKMINIFSRISEFIYKKTNDKELKNKQLMVAKTANNGRI